MVALLEALQFARSCNYQSARQGALKGELPPFGRTRLPF